MGLVLVPSGGPTLLFLGVVDKIMESGAQYPLGGSAWPSRVPVRSDCKEGEALARGFSRGPAARRQATSSEPHEAENDDEPSARVDEGFFGVSGKEPGPSDIGG